ncbi:GNAT family N-acetyltransferase [Panacibacter ginsenosidivorans]|uniref:GNAT family N-acetyltransferase n=1 Tax=Panacibacter ginsenosidivorans TaxID=1813871 RepID=A0A5B8V9U8_9BACT|nr:GNAT family protein [Panacibacter ginsenosidivorans]QEC68204.1 GNAT family N-acetyltransferase [Panacibacter ginsenosidivorans]
MFKLIPLAHRNSHIAYLGGLAIDPAFAGKGYGCAMLNEILAYAKQQRFLRVELSVATINEKAVHLYEKAGFVKEGIFRKFTHLKSENRFLDEVIMAWLDA